MFRTTQDVVEIRRWAEARGACPSRDERTGHLRLTWPGEAGACNVGWEEFEPAFLVRREVLVYDDAPGSQRCFLGPAAAALAFIRGALPAEVEARG